MACLDIDPLFRDVAIVAQLSNPSPCACKRTRVPEERSGERKGSTRRGRCVGVRISRRFSRVCTELSMHAESLAETYVCGEKVVDFLVDKGRFQRTSR